MDVLGVAISIGAVIGNIITIWSFMHSRSKEIQLKSENDATMRSDMKYLREKMDEANMTLKDLCKDNGHHETVISQHEVRIKALEDWRHDFEKQSAYKKGE